MSSTGILYVCFATCLLPATFSAKTAMSRHQLELKEHYEHLAKIAEFECDLPQPRLLSVQDLLSNSQMRGKAYFPEVTLLHRCDRHVGSCNDASYKCGPTNATPVNMPFKVTFLEDMEGRSKGKWEMEYHSFENHTSCGCLKYEEVQKPAKTAVHYHYVDPSFMPPQSFLPLDPTSQNVSGNASSYDVPVYQLNNTQQPSSTECANQPSIYEMTALAEEVVGPKPDEEPNSKPSEENNCVSCDKSQGYPGYPGYPDTESSTDEVRVSSPTPKYSSYFDEDKASDATTITSDLIRFGAGDSPRSEALTDVADSPYDSLLKKASS